jgi:glycosyltransferase involved in cell wall biosynthesis
LGPETSPGHRKQLEAQAAAGPDAHRVIFLGRSRTPTRWLQASDVFLSGSEYEGMPLAPIEAGGAGVPLVLSDIQGHHVLSGKARFFPFNDQVQGANALEEELKALESGASRDRLETIARDIRANHSGAAMASAYMSLYKGQEHALQEQPQA